MNVQYIIKLVGAWYVPEYVLYFVCVRGMINPSFQKFGTCAAKCLTIEFYVQMLLFGSTLPMAKFNVHTLTHVYMDIAKGRKQQTYIAIKLNLVCCCCSIARTRMSLVGRGEYRAPIQYASDEGGIVVNACLCYIVYIPM